jgi:hypothetical protein
MAFPTHTYSKILDVDHEIWKARGQIEKLGPLSEAYHIKHRALWEAFQLVEGAIFRLHTVASALMGLASQAPTHHDEMALRALAQTIDGGREMIETNYGHWGQGALPFLMTNWVQVETLRRQAADSQRDKDSVESLKKIDTETLEARLKEIEEELEEAGKQAPSLGNSAIKENLQRIRSALKAALFQRVFSVQRRPAHKPQEVRAKAQGLEAADKQIAEADTQVFKENLLRVRTMLEAERPQDPPDVPTAEDMLTSEPHDGELGKKMILRALHSAGLEFAPEMAPPDTPEQVSAVAHATDNPREEETP